jgi:hypothetical protein
MIAVFSYPRKRLIKAVDSAMIAFETYSPPGSFSNFEMAVAMIVHCGLPQESFEALVPCVPNYCPRKFWKKLSISVIGVSKKLRRLSSVGQLARKFVESN